MKKISFLVVCTLVAGLPPGVVAELAEPVSGKADFQMYAVCMDPNLDFSTYHGQNVSGDI